MLAEKTCRRTLPFLETKPKPPERKWLVTSFDLPSKKLVGGIIPRRLFVTSRLIYIEHPGLVEKSDNSYAKALVILGYMEVSSSRATAKSSISSVYRWIFHLFNHPSWATSMETSDDPNGARQATLGGGPLGFTALNRRCTTWPWGSDV